MRVLQLIDTLEVGGAERMAVNLTNSLLNYNIESYICTTRQEGQLKDALNNKAPYIFLNKKAALDLKAVLRLRRFIKKNEIDIIHAHGTSFFFATIVKCFAWDVKVIWHDHFGNRTKDTSFLKLVVLKLCSFSFSAIYCVNTDLQVWAIKNLNCKKVNFIENYPTTNIKANTILKGNTGKRILCLANLREPKNHQLLFNAFNKFVKDYDDWSLHCIGGISEDNYSENLKNYIKENELGNHIFLYGTREDISHIISQSNIGVLTSSFEGLPMALLEYGLGKLPVLTTDVGYCGNLISDKSYGILVASKDEAAILKGLKLYALDLEYRKKCAENLHGRITKKYSEEKVLSNIIKDYELIIMKL